MRFCTLYRATRLRSRSVVTQHLATLGQIKRLIIKAAGEFGGLGQSQGYLHILHLPGVSTKETHSPSPHRCIQMQSKVNIIMHPLFFRAFCSGFNMCSAIYFSCCRPFVHLFPFKVVGKKSKLCAGSNSICVEICCIIFPAGGQDKNSYFRKWRYATVIAHLVLGRPNLL